MLLLKVQRLQSFKSLLGIFERHKDSFERGYRMAMPLRSLLKGSADKKTEDIEAYQDIIRNLSNGLEYVAN